MRPGLLCLLLGSSFLVTASILFPLFYLYILNSEEEDGNVWILFNAAVYLISNLEEAEKDLHLLRNLCLDLHLMGKQVDLYPFEGGGVLQRQKVHTIGQVVDLAVGWKTGIGTNLTRAISDFQTGSPEGIEVILWIPGEYAYRNKRVLTEDLGKSLKRAEKMIQNEKSYIMDNHKMLKKDTTQLKLVNDNKELVNWLGNRGFNETSTTEIMKVSTKTSETPRITTEMDSTTIASQSTANLPPFTEKASSETQKGIKTSPGTTITVEKGPTTTSPISTTNLRTEPKISSEKTEETTSIPDRLTSGTSTKKTSNLEIITSTSVFSIKTTTIELGSTTTTNQKENTEESEKNQTETSTGRTKKGVETSPLAFTTEEPVIFTKITTPEAKSSGIPSSTLKTTVTNSLPVCETTSPSISPTWTSDEAFTMEATTEKAWTDEKTTEEPTKTTSAVQMLETTGSTTKIPQTEDILSLTTPKVEWTEVDTEKTATTENKLTEDGKTTEKVSTKEITTEATEEWTEVRTKTTPASTKGWTKAEKTTRNAFTENISTEKPPKKTEETEKWTEVTNIETPPEFSRTSVTNTNGPTTIEDLNTDKQWTEEISTQKPLETTKSPVNYTEVTKKPTEEDPTTESPIKTEFLEKWTEVEGTTVTESWTEASGTSELEISTASPLKTTTIQKHEPTTVENWSEASSTTSASEITEVFTKEDGITDGEGEKIAETPWTSEVPGLITTENPVENKTEEEITTETVEWTTAETENLVTTGSWTREVTIIIKEDQTTSQIQWTEGFTTESSGKPQIGEITTEKEWTEAETTAVSEDFTSTDTENPVKTDSWTELTVTTTERSHITEEEKTTTESYTKNQQTRAFSTESSEKWTSEDKSHSSTGTIHTEVTEAGPTTEKTIKTDSSEKWTAAERTTVSDSWTEVSEPEITTANPLKTTVTPEIIDLTTEKQWSEAEAEEITQKSEITTATMEPGQSFTTEINPRKGTEEKENETTEVSWTEEAVSRPSGSWTEEVTVENGPITTDEPTTEKLWTERITVGEDGPTTISPEISSENSTAFDVENPEESSSAGNSTSEDLDLLPMGANDPILALLLR